MVVSCADLLSLLAKLAESGGGSSSSSTNSNSSPAGDNNDECRNRRASDTNARSRKGNCYNKIKLFVSSEELCNYIFADD